MSLVPFGVDFQTRDMQAGAANAPSAVWVAKLTQAGTAAPTAIEYTNTLGTVALGRSSTGVYTLTTDGLFTDGLTFVQVTLGGTAVICKAVLTSENVITLSTLDAATPSAADLVGDAFVSVFVYPDTV